MADRSGEWDAGREVEREALREGEHADRVEAAIERERARREALRLLDAEARGTITTPEILTLRERLARPRETVRDRIEGWQPAESRVICAAQYKAGKTTLVGSLVRALVDGDLFLGVAPVTPIAGTVALVDVEMAPGRLDAWLRDQRIRHDDRVIVISLRGAAGSFDLLEPACRARWAGWLRERQVQYLAVDCLRPIMDSVGLDEHRDAGRFLTAIDALLREAAIPECLLVHHMGHTNERSRGDSRLRDWPDVEWRLVRQDENPESPRYLSAYGRDVDIREQQLAYDPLTRRLTVAGGSRQDARTDRVLDAIIEALTEAPQPLTGRGIARVLESSDHSRDAIYGALKAGVRTGQLTVEDGPRKSRLYRVSGSVRPASGVRSQERVSECPSVFSRDGHSGHSATPQQQPPELLPDPYSQEPERCCEGGPLRLECRLCRQSPTYWRRDEAVQ